MNTTEILDLMEELLEDAATMPFSGGKRMVNADKFHDLIDDMRMTLPQEIKQARAIVADRADIVATAKEEAETIIKRAETRAAALLSEQEVVKQAQQKSAEIITSTQQQVREMRSTVSEYCENMLRQTEEVVTKSAADIRNVRTSLRQAPKKPL